MVTQEQKDELVGKTVKVQLESKVIECRIAGRVMPFAIVYGGWRDTFRSEYAWGTVARAVANGTTLTV